MSARLRSPRRTARGALAALATLATLGEHDAARAHGGDPRVRAVLGALPAELVGVRVELHHTIAPQVVLENRTSRTVEVLDDEGVAFLRVGPRGVEGNAAARAWYQTQAPGSPVPAAARHGAAARWVRARAEPAFGWFDPRLEPHDGHGAHAGDVAPAARGADPGAWRIPLRVDGAPVVLSGTFRRAETPPGAHVARLTSPAEIAPGVRVRLLPGRRPGLLLANDGADDVVVLDADETPLLRIGRAGVEANVHSAAWRASGRAGSTAGAASEASRASGAEDPPAARGAPRWVRVAHAPRYGWIDPRLARDATSADRHASVEPIAWHVPLVIGGRRVAVRGELAWRPAPRAAAGSPPSP